MIRNLKALGLALCALCAFGALSASAASAANDSLTSGSVSGTTYLTGTQIGGLGPANVFGSKSSAGLVECTSATYSGKYAGTTATSVEVTPAYTGCKIGKSNATVTDNGCKFVLTGTTDVYINTEGKTEEEEVGGKKVKKEDATVSLNCGDTGSIVVDGPLGCVITFSDTHPANTKVNQNLLGAKYDNEADGAKWDIKLTATVDKVVFTSNANCASLGFAATGTDGFLTTNVTVRAYETLDVGPPELHTNQVNLTWS